MSDDLEALARVLHAVLAQYPPEQAQAVFRKHTASFAPDHQERLTRLVFGAISADGEGGLAVGDSRLVSPGLSKDRLDLSIKGAPPGSGGRIPNYLLALVEQHDWLRLNRLLGKELSGNEEATVEAIRLRSVYTQLTTSSWVAGETFTLPKEEVLKIIDQGDPSRVLPNKVRIAAISPPDRDPDSLESAFRQRYALDSQAATFSETWARVRRDIQRERGGLLSGQWYVPEPLDQGLYAERRIVLLGAPGSGKSTVLRHLVVAFAQRLLEGQTLSTTNPLPFFCPLGRVAQELGDDPSKDMAILLEVMLHPLAGGAKLDARVQREVRPLLLSGAALLCFDGLDEVSGTPRQTHKGRHSHRERIAEAIRKVASTLDRAMIIVTCRTKPYQQDASWQLRDGWTPRTLAPMSFGQVRYFVRTWYTQTSQHSKSYSRVEADQRAARLTTALESRSKLQEITTSPLLLTMLALLDYNNKQLPEKRVDVYEELVKLLLDRWEMLRSEGERPKETLGERLELEHLDVEKIRRVVHDLAYEAHCSAVDGRGVVRSETLRAYLDDFFARQLDPENPRRVPPKELARRSALFEQLLRDETGLIQQEDDETYVLPHLTFQEYLCACRLASSEDIVRIYDHWRESGDRWRDVILLLMGRMLHHEKYQMAFNWLQQLLSHQLPPRGKEQRPGLTKSPASLASQAKSVEQRQHDALFASVCYIELGRQSQLGGRVPDIEGLERKLRDALIDTIQQPSPALLMEQRIDVARELLILGDKRYPVTSEEWAQSIPHTGRHETPEGGTSEPYWCPVPRGVYQVGGWQPREVAARVSLPDFWIARFPVTVGQFARFVEVGYQEEGHWCWTPAGLRWLQSHGSTGPFHWRQQPYHIDNQPVVGVTWYEAAAFAQWLNGQLGDRLPPGYSLRLPTEAEWEVAAAYRGGKRYARPWGVDDIDPDRAVYEAALMRQPAPVGCCPRGKAECGAQDMLGNVWELMASSFRDYPARSTRVTEDVAQSSFKVVWRGGMWDSSEAQLHCGFRQGNHLHIVHGLGFRLVLAPAR